MPVSVPVSLFLGPPPGPAQGKPPGRTAQPGGLPPGIGGVPGGMGWYLLGQAAPGEVQTGIGVACLYGDGANWPSPDWYVVSGPYATAEECSCNLDGSCGPGQPTPTPVPAPTPTPTPGTGQPGASCDAPLFVQVCGPGAPTTTPPPTPTPSPGPCDPATDPSCSQPPGPPPSPGSAAGSVACQSRSCEQFLQGLSLQAPGGTLAEAILGPEPADGRGIVATVVQDMLDAIEADTNQIAGPFYCGATATIPAVALRTLAATIQQYTGALPEVVRVLTYAVNCACPTVLPSVAEADAAYLAGAIQPAEWEYWVSAGGRCPVQERLLLDAGRTRLTIPDALRLWWRGQLSDDEVSQALRQRGVIYPADEEQLLRSTEAWPSAGQAIDAWFRFRPDRDRALEDPLSAAQTVTDADLDELLRGQEYADKWRPLIAALTYTIPSIRQHQMGLQVGVWTKAEVVNNLRRHHYSAADAERVAEIYSRRASAARLREILSTSGSLFARAWELGTLDDAGVLSDFRGLGLSEQEAAVALTLTRARYQQARVERQLRVLRAGFLRGTFSEDDVRAQLSRSAIVPDRTDDYLADWTLELEGRRREVSIGELVRDACKGIVPVPVLAQRLRALRMSDEDIQIRLQEVALCVSDREVKLLTQQQRAAEKNQRAALSAVKAQKALLSEAQRVLAKHGSPAQLAAWYWEGSVTAGEVYARLDFLGWPDADIARLLRQHEPRPKAAGSPKGHSGSGAGAPGG